MFEQAFSWFDSPLTSPLPTINYTLTRPSCLAARELASQQHQHALRDYSALRHSHPLPEKQKQSHLNLQQAERYLSFINACEQTLAKTQEQSIFWLLLTLCLSDKEKSAHAPVVFEAWLRFDSILAYQFYENYFSSTLQATTEEDVSQNNTLALNMGTVCVKHYLQNLNLTLQHQSDPLGLCRVSLAFIDNPLRFTACVIWMIEQGGSIPNLVRTGILHSYINYYFPNFGVFDQSFNEVSLLYKIIEQFEAGKFLTDYAQNISCGVRGFTRHNLLGQRSLSLQTIDCAPPFPLLTRTIENLKQIIEVFGDYGLIQSLSDLFHDSDDEFDRLFIQFMQASMHLISPSLIKQTAEDRPNELYKWARLIDDSMFQRWIFENKLSILYLLPYRPEWIGSINDSMMQLFLDSIDTTDTPGNELEKAKLLLSLYEATISIKSPLTELIYQSLFDFILTHRYLLDDHHVFVTLKQSKYLTKLIKTKNDELISHLTNKINAFLFSNMTLINLNDLIQDWHLLEGAFEVLGLLTKVHSAFPITKLNFTIYVFKQSSLNPVKSWNRLLEIFELSESELNMTDYQHELLYKLLAHIDDAELQNIILSKLALTDAVFTTEKRSILLSGITAGNIGLLDWYLANNTLDDDLVQHALNTKQWTMIHHWFNSYDFSDNSQEIIDELLIGVAGSKNTTLLRGLIKESNLHFSTYSIKEAFSKAASMDDPSALNYLYLLKPKPMTIKAAFSQAVKDEHYKSLSFFKRLRKRHDSLANSVLTEFNAAVKKNNLDLIAFLMAFSANSPSQDNVKAAKLRLEDKELQHTIKTKKSISKNDTNDANASPTSTEIVQFLNHCLTTSSIAQNTEPHQKPRLPVTKSFFSTDSLTRPSSSLFGSPVIINR